MLHSLCIVNCHFCRNGPRKRAEDFVAEWTGARRKTLYRGLAARMGLTTFSRGLPRGTAGDVSSPAEAALR